MKNGNKTAIGCSTFLLIWFVASVLLVFLFNSINTTNQPMEATIFFGVFLAFFFSLIIFAFVMIFITSGKRKSKNIPNQPFVNPYVDVTLYDSGNQFPTVYYNNIVLKPGEQIIFAVPAQTFVQKEQVVGYTGGSTGASIRVAKGVTVRRGSNRGTPIRQNVTKFNDGDYIVTTNRLLFLSQNESFELSIEKISACKIIAQDAFMIMQGNKQKNICVDISQAKYAAGLTRWAIEEYHKNKVTK